MAPGGSGRGRIPATGGEMCWGKWFEQYQGEVRDSFWALEDREAHRRMRSTVVGGRPMKLDGQGRSREPV
jgi:hypothetical protein